MPRRWPASTSRRMVAVSDRGQAISQQRSLINAGKSLGNPCKMASDGDEGKARGMRREGERPAVTYKPGPDLLLLIGTRDKTARASTRYHQRRKLGVARLVQVFVWLPTSERGTLANRTW
jgi:hypothetical protein